MKNPILYVHETVNKTDSMKIAHSYIIDNY